MNVYFYTIVVLVAACLLAGRERGQTKRSVPARARGAGAGVSRVLVWACVALAGFNTVGAVGLVGRLAARGDAAPGDILDIFGAVFFWFPAIVLALCAVRFSARPRRGGRGGGRARGRGGAGRSGRSRSRGPRGRSRSRSRAPSAGPSRGRSQSRAGSVSRGRSTGPGDLAALTHRYQLLGSVTSAGGDIVFGTGGVTGATQQFRKYEDDLATVLAGRLAQHKALRLLSVTIRLEWYGFSTGSGKWSCAVYNVGDRADVVKWANFDTKPVYTAALPRKMVTMTKRFSFPESRFEADLKNVVNATRNPGVVVWAKMFEMPTGATATTVLGRLFYDWNYEADNADV